MKENATKTKSEKMESKKETEEFEPNSLQDFQDWLEKNHDKKKGVWLVLAKKGSGLPSITVDEAIDASLCFGWVDSLPNKIDALRYKLYISPRNPKSNWSRVNKEKIKRLEKEGRVHPSGKKMVDLAKASGTWTALDEVENLVIPEDLKRALEKEKGALMFFDAFPKSVKRGILEWIQNAKQEVTRNKRIKETALLAKENIRANQYTKKQEKQK